MGIEKGKLAQEEKQGKRDEDSEQASWLIEVKIYFFHWFYLSFPLRTRIRLPHSRPHML